MDNETEVYCQAATRWPIQGELLELVIEKLTQALEVSTKNRDVVRITNCLARLYGQNQQAALANRYMEAVSDGTHRPILPPHETANAMLASVPGVSEAHQSESIIDAQVIHIEQHDRHADNEKPFPCPPLVPPDVRGTGVRG